jgi:hypothetical protein
VQDATAFTLVYGYQHFGGNSVFVLRYSKKSETLAPIYQSARRHISEEGSFHQHGCENLITAQV